MSKIQAVLFDYGMVLSAPADPHAWARMRLITGLSEELLHREYWAYRHAYDRGDLTGEAYWQALGRGANIALSDAQIADLIAADVDLWAQLNPPMVAWARQLQQARIPTGILSNIGDAMTIGLLARHPWLTNFNYCLWSHTLNMAKPEPAIYLAAAAGLNTPPVNILFIDDKAENIAAAISIGMQAIQYSTHEAFEREMHTRNLGHLLEPDLQLEWSRDSQIGKI
jgi:putative hydrolase of the HAD superfamily